MKSGGFTALNTLSPLAVDPFQPETLYAYEVGEKAQLFDRSLTLNVTGFFYDYRDQQVQGIFQSVVGGTNATVGRIGNAPRSQIYGAELELTWRPIEGLVIGQTASYNKGEYRRFLDLGLDAKGKAFVIDRRGQDLGNPHWLYQGNIAYTVPLGDRYGLTGAVDYNFRDQSTLAVLRSAGDQVHDRLILAGRRDADARTQGRPVVGGAVGPQHHQRTV